MLVATLALVAGMAQPAAAAQEASSTLTVSVRCDGRPVARAIVRVAEVSATTGADGRASLLVRPGQQEIIVEAAGYLPASTVGTLDAGVSEATLELKRLESEVVVTATRSGTRLPDQPLRVEVIDREDIEEKALMTPGNVATLLGETSGLRVQVTAPSLGQANVRIQGLRGRYSQLLADGLPLYGAQGDSLSLLQVAPLDLGQVEVIKGVASALYGPAALGGVVDLISRRPRGKEDELLLNATSLEGVDAMAWVAREGRWAWSATLGYHGQERRDVDADGWSDVAGYDRGAIRPRLSFDNGRGETLLATAGATIEDREGGTLSNRLAPDGQAFEESVKTRNADGGVVWRKLLEGGRLVSGRASFRRGWADQRFGAERETGAHTTWFGEASLQGASGRHTFVAGLAFQQDLYDSEERPAFNYAFSAPAAFAQDEIVLGPRLSIALSGRVDAHSQYGTLASPRISVLARPRRGFTVRLSGGTGSFAPTPFNEDTEATGLSRLLPLSGLKAEAARGVSMDASWKSGGLEVTGTLFGSEITRPTEIKTVSATTVALVNASEPTRTWGSEILARYRVEDFTVMLTHAWTRSTEMDVDAGGRREVPLTPRHTASLDAIWEQETKGRLGVELYYVGRQALEDDPYRSTGRPYTLLGFFGERRFGKLRLFANLEDLFDVRQTREERLVRPTRRADGRWTVDAWAPLDGRVLNGGVRLIF
jgi:outer membrane receptor for ferrienterochelin and colicins